jgi:hypothetical protein
MAKQTALGKFTMALHAMGINSILSGEGIEIQTITIHTTAATPQQFIDFHFNKDGSFRCVDAGKPSSK